MTPEREDKIKKVLAHRQPNLTVILENVRDLHNLGAVLRSCDSVGIMEMFVLQTEKGLQNTHLVLGKRTSAGARKWVDVHYYQDVEACFSHVREKSFSIYSTHLTESAVSLYELDLTQPTALLFGNENTGLTKEALAHADGNFLIPQMGMVKSLNLSVACAVSLYEAYRQRSVKGMYENSQITPKDQSVILQEYKRRHEEGIGGFFTDLIK